jgi:hypothetical protein
VATCDFCDGEKPDGAKACPHCGRGQATPGEAQHRWIRIVIFAVLLVAVMVAWSWATGFSANPG